jgi:hypothetical protein
MNGKEMLDHTTLPNGISDLSLQIVIIFLLCSFWPTVSLGKLIKDNYESEGVKVITEYWESKLHFEAAVENKNSYAVKVMIRVRVSYPYENKDDLPYYNGEVTTEELLHLSPRGKTTKDISLITSYPKTKIGPREAQRKVVFDIKYVTKIEPVPITANLNGDSFTFTEGDVATLIDQGGNATVMDGDSDNFDGGNLTTTIASGGDAANDELSFDTSGSVDLAGTTVGSKVSVSGTVIGTLAKAISAGNNLVVDLNNNATPDKVQILIRAITYKNIATENPSTGARKMQVTVNDGDGKTSSDAEVTVTVVARNDGGTSADAKVADNSTSTDKISPVLYLCVNKEGGTVLNAGAQQSCPSGTELRRLVVNLSDCTAQCLAVDEAMSE